MRALREYLREHTLLFDGAMGTYLALRTRRSHRMSEWANLECPGEVEKIHREYLAAGSMAIKTNTFAANRLNIPEESCEKLIRAGCEIALRCAGDAAWVFADIGPIPEGEGREPLTEYRWLIDRFLEQGLCCFLFETQSGDDCLHEAAAYIKEKAPEAFILCSFAVQPGGYTGEGEMAEELLARAAADENIDAVGFNCAAGARDMKKLLRRLGPVEKPFSVMPNAGYPTVRGNNAVYEGKSGYFARQIAEMQALGAKILGGCCGTTPEHIAAIPEALAAGTVPVKSAAPERAKPEKAAEEPFWLALCDPAKRPFAVELDPPKIADTENYMRGALELREAGADIITVADCPVARTRMDAGIVACKLQRELGVSALPHMTCRDRNLNATQALLLGLCAEGVRNVLIVTGDPIPSASRDEVKSVYNFNSRRLIHFVAGLNENSLPRPFHIFAALNVNVRNFSVQLDMARRKEENGAEGFLTQPVLSAEGLENLRRAREALKGKLLGGIMPIVSQKSAVYMNSEIAGIRVDEAIIARYEGADRERGEALALEISADYAKAMRPFVDGFYIITPPGRTALVARIMEKIRRDAEA